MENDEDNKIPLIREWYKVQSELKSLQERERELRAQVVESVFEADRKGTQKFDLSDTMVLTLSVSSKIDVDKEAFERHKMIMDRKGLLGDGGVITLKPSVSATAYKYMSSEDKAAFAEVFKHGFNSPQLSVKSKKD